MSRINRVPRGLQDLFGNTAAGRNPADLLQEVRPIIDLLPLWITEKLDYVPFTGSFAAVFQQNTIRVPQGELWIPVNLSADCTTTVIGESIGFVIGYSNPANDRRCYLGESTGRVSTTALETTTAQYTWSNYAPLLPGEYVFAQCHKFDAAAARTCQIKFKFYRIKI